MGDYVRLGSNVHNPFFNVVSMWFYRSCFGQLKRTIRPLDRGKSLGFQSVDLSLKIEAVDIVFVKYEGNAEQDALTIYRNFPQAPGLK